MAETLSAKQIASVIGIDPALATGLCDWFVPTHDQYVISELITAGSCVAFRVRDKTTGEAWTKLPDDGGITLDAAKVDAIYTEVMRIGVLKNVTVPKFITSVLGADHKAITKNDDDSLDLKTTPDDFAVDANGILTFSLGVYSEADAVTIRGALTGSKFAAQIRVT